MQPGKFSYILIDEANEDDAIIVDLSTDEWDEPTRPCNRILNSYRNAPTIRDFHTGLLAVVK